MKALVKTKAEPGIWFDVVPEPECGPTDVVVKIKKTGICGTDVSIFQWNQWAQQHIPIPLVIGHEFYGEIVAMGSEVYGYKQGQRVSGEGHIACGVCRNCRAGFRHLCRATVGIGVNVSGAFAEYLVVPASNIFPLPDDVSDDMAAILDPLGNATHAALTFDLLGEDVLITGAGPIGCMAAAIARHAGARHIVVTDVRQHRLKLAETMGASIAVNPEQQSLSNVMKQLGMREGFDVALEMSSSGQAINDIIQHACHGAGVALLGFLPNDTQIDWSQINFRGLTIKGIYGRQMFESWYKMTSMLQSGLDIQPVITHHFHVDEFQQAFETMASGQSGKVILDWD